MIGDRTAPAVKGGIKASDLKQFWTTLQKSADRCKIVRLMQRSERDIPFEVCDNRLVESNRLIVFRPAVHNPVTDRNEIEALGFTQPSRDHRHSRGHIWNASRLIGRVDQRRLVISFGAQARARADAVDLAFDLALQGLPVANAESLELKAR